MRFMNGERESSGEKWKGGEKMNFASSLNCVDLLLWPEVGAL